MAISAGEFFGLEMLGTGGASGSTSANSLDVTDQDVDRAVDIAYKYNQEGGKSWDMNSLNSAGYSQFRDKFRELAPGAKDFGDAVNQAYSAMRWDDLDWWNDYRERLSGAPASSPIPAGGVDDGKEPTGSDDHTDWQSGGSGSGSGGSESGPGVNASNQYPADMNAIRLSLSNLLNKYVNSKPIATPGGVTVAENPNFQKAIDLIVEAMSGGSTRDINDARGLIGDATRGSLPGLATARTTAADLQKDGGVPDMTAALAAIRTQGMQDIDYYNAEEIERYGAMGLGAGSDVAAAVATGSSRGVSDILARQEALIVDIMSKGEDRKLLAADLGGRLSTTDADNKLKAAGLLPILAELERTSAMNAGTLMGQIAQNQQGVAERNIDRQITEADRMSRPPLLNESLAYATGFPPIQNKPVVQGTGSNWGQIGATLGSSFISILPWLSALSSRELKEDIVPLEEDMLEKAANLPLYRWRYKGDPVKHLGPIAEEFHETFGVGDGKTIHLADVMGVVLATNKALAMKHVGRGSTNATR
jgi:hypothetical protein